MSPLFCPHFHTLLLLYQALTQAALMAESGGCLDNHPCPPMDRGCICDADKLGDPEHVGRLGVGRPD